MLDLCFLQIFSWVMLCQLCVCFLKFSTPYLPPSHHYIFTTTIIYCNNYIWWCTCSEKLLSFFYHSLAHPFIQLVTVKFICWRKKLSTWQTNLIVVVFVEILSKYNGYYTRGWNQEKILNVDAAHAKEVAFLWTCCIIGQFFVCKNGSPDACLGWVCHLLFPFSPCVCAGSNACPMSSQLLYLGAKTVFLIANTLIFLKKFLSSSFNQHPPLRKIIGQVCMAMPTLFNAINCPTCKI